MEEKKIDDCCGNSHKKMSKNTMTALIVIVVLVLLGGIYQINAYIKYRKISQIITNMEEKNSIIKQ